jgi:hypothetical protein
VTTDGHWVKWHAPYADPLSSISRRLVVVQRRLGQVLDDAPQGSIRLISMCAGQGRDVIGVLQSHPRASDVGSLLVELDVHLVQDARTSADRARLTNLKIDVGDASFTSSYAGAVPADVLLICGVFGNISDADIHASIVHLPHLLAPSGTVIWTRHRREPDLTPAIRVWFDESGFEEVAFETESGTSFGVGTHRLIGPPQTFEPNRTLFKFIGDGAAAHL